MTGRKAETVAPLVLTSRGKSYGDPHRITTERVVGGIGLFMNTKMGDYLDGMTGISVTLSKPDARRLAEHLLRLVND